jgi:hypothetical protein
LSHGKKQERNLSIRKLWQPDRVTFTGASALWGSLRNALEGHEKHDHESPLIAPDNGLQIALAIIYRVGKLWRGAHGTKL